MGTDLELAVLKAITRQPMRVDEVAMLSDMTASEIMVEHELDLIQIQTLTAHLRHEIQRHNMSSISSAHHHPTDEEMEKIL